MVLQILPGKVGWPMGYPNNMSTFVVKRARATALAVDAVTRKVLWKEGDAFLRCNFDGSGTEELFRLTIFFRVNGIIVEPISGQLYMTDMINDVVVRSDMSGKNLKIVHTEKGSAPFRLALGYDNE